MEKMKYISLLLFFVAGCSFSQENVTTDHVHYFSGTMEELQTKAGKEKKPYIVDFYTDWCGYCKKLDATTFRDPNVVEMMNSGFITYKLNAEKRVGRSMARKHQVKGYPTLIIFNHDHTVLKIVPGYYGAQDFLNIIKPYAVKSKKAVRENTQVVEKTDIYKTEKKKYYEALTKDIEESYAVRKKNLISLAREYSKAEKEFDFENLLTDLTEKDNVSEALLKIHYHLAVNRLDKAKTLIIQLASEEQLSTEELHLFTLIYYINNQVDTQVLKWINQAYNEEKTYEIVDTKVAIHVALKELKDAKTAYKKAKKIASKSKDAILLDRVALLDKLIQAS